MGLIRRGNAVYDITHSTYYKPQNSTEKIDKYTQDFYSKHIAHTQLLKLLFT